MRSEVEVEAQDSCLKRLDSGFEEFGVREKALGRK